MPDRPLAVYVHFPWCLAKCPYCDFASYAPSASPSDARAAIPHAAYADAVLAELDLRRGLVRGATLTSVFFGGGTPSLWEPAELGRVLAGVREAVGHERDVEVTVECNPTSLDEAKARALGDVGVTRLSVGVQGLDAERLRFLGRLHSPDGALHALRAALASGVPRVSGDLLFGVEGGKPQTPDEAAREAGAVADTGVTHVSAYGLTIEPATRFGELAKRGRLPIASDDAQASSFEAVERALEARGLVHYEVSNYAKPGHEARHNLAVWRGQEYLGLGVSAVGATRTGEGVSRRRYKNDVAPARYLAGLGAGRLAEQEDEALDAETLLRERILLGLRLAEGVDLDEAAGALGVAWRTKERLRALEREERAGRVRVEGARVRVTREARLFTDGVAAAVM